MNRKPRRPEPSGIAEPAVAPPDKMAGPSMRPGAQSGPTMPIVVAAVAGVLAAWIAAGSIGLAAHPLRHALTWLAMGVVLVAAWPGRVPRADLAILGAAVAAGIALSVPAGAAYNIAAIALVLAVLARLKSGIERRVLLVTAFAATTLAVYRLACTSIPTAWLVADAAGHALGRLAGAVCGKPLSIGATFAGLDFLVLMAALYAGWLFGTSPPRFARAVYAAAAILGGQLVYLILLACSTDLAAWLPVVTPPPDPDIASRYVPPPWYWSDALRTLLPWNLPLVAAAIQAAVAGLMFRWASWPADEQGPSTEDRPRNHLGTVPIFAQRKWDCPPRTGWPSRQLPAWLALGPIALAILVPLLTTLSFARGDLSGRKIVAYERGLLNWDKPAADRYGRQSAGLYGTLPTLIESLGGEFARSATLAAADLDGADVLILIHPTDRWSETPERLERIWDFVRGGGSLLVVAEPYQLQEDGQASTFNEVLGPSGMEVRFDTAIGETGSWQHALEGLIHRATLGIADERNGFGLGETASIRARWPAWPLVVGRWGWSDPGSDAVLTGVHRFDAGERLGDLVLAAQQREGKGRVAVLGDAGSLTNVGSGNCYEFVGKLLGHLAAHGDGPQAGWRQFLGLLGCLALIAMAAWRLDPSRLAAVALALPASLGLCTAITCSSATILPDGRTSSGNYLACVDASHLDAYSGDDWQPDGIAGLRLMLMRNGYLPIVVPRLAEAQLGRAGLLISIAPSRGFSAPEREAVRRFVRRGGVWIVMAGADRAGPVGPLLAQFGVTIPRSPLAAGESGEEPLPMGGYRAAYGEEDKRRREVYFQAGWPVECSAERAEVLVAGFDGLPAVVAVGVENGTVVVIGDSEFGLNRNLDAPDGDLAEGARDNARFWQWLLTRVKGGPAREGSP